LSYLLLKWVHIVISTVLLGTGAGIAFFMWRAHRTRDARVIAAVAAAVKQASPQTPVILLTGWGERLLAEGRAVAHVDRVLGKPPRLRDLRQALAELVSARKP